MRHICQALFHRFNVATRTTFCEHRYVGHHRSILLSRIRHLLAGCNYEGTLQEIGGEAQRRSDADWSLQRIMLELSVG